MPPTITNLSPVDTGNLGVIQPITFSVIDTAPFTTAAPIWMKYEGEEDEVLVWDGAEFSYPFDTNSKFELPNGDRSNLTFSVVPELGWRGNVEKFRVEPQDLGASVVRDTQVLNVTGVPYSKNTPITFDVVGASFILVWVRFSTDRRRILVYESDGFVGSFAGFSTETSGSFSIIEKNGWRDRPLEIVVQAIGATGFVNRRDIIANPADETVPMLQDNGIFLPTISSHFSSLSLPTPTHLYQIQETSGDLADDFGSRPMSPVGSPTYNETMAGFLALKGVEIKSASDGYFQDATGWNPGSASMAVYGLIQHPNLSAGATRLAYFAGSGDRMDIDSSGFLRAYLDNAAGIGTTAYDDNTVHPFLWVLDHNANTLKCYTEDEVITGTYSAGPHSGFTRIGNANSVTVNDWRCGRLAVWIGAAAEGMDQTVLTALGHTVSY